MASEICPSCGAEEVRFSARRGLHLLRALLGTRKRYCAQCKARWGTRVRGGWPVPIRLAVLAACGAGAWTVSHARLVRREPAPKPIYFRGAAVKPAIAGEEGDAIPSPEEPPAALVERAGGTTADWLRAHQQDSTGAALPRRPEGFLSKLGLGSLERFGKILRLKLGGLTPAQAAQLENELKKDKRQLWNEYGSNFSSKEEAKKTYEQAQQELRKHKAGAAE